MELVIPATNAGAAAWTAVVPWARVWHRPAAVRQQGRPKARIAWTAFSMGDSLDRPTQEAWTAALKAQSAARQQLAEFGGDLDSWPAVMARHAAHLATARVRLHARQLELVEGVLAGAGTHR